MDLPKDIIQRCHKRHKETLHQRKTVVTPALYKKYSYNLKVYCARRYPVMLDDLESADISFMPIGRAPKNDSGPKDFGGDRFLERQGTQSWRQNSWFTSWGIQIYTGIPSERDGARWHDLEFTYQALCAAPDAVIACVEILAKITVNPLLVLTKSGGLRFSCRVPDYLHSDAEAAKLYIYKHAPTLQNPYHRDVYLEVLGKNGYSCWDARYEILCGNMLDPPVIAKELLFHPINALRDALHAPEPQGETPPEPTITAPSTLGSDDLDLAKEAFLKRGFTYLKQDADFHHWVFHGSDGENIYAWLWEEQGTVWVRASMPISGLMVRGMPIASIWDDTGIAVPATPGMPITDEKLAVREGKLSPLAIKRPKPVLSREEFTNEIHETQEANADQVQRVFEMDARVIGINTDTDSGINNIIESYLRSGGAICLNIASRNLAETAEQRFKALKLPSFARWKARKYRWEEVKDIPIDERMANPFERGNACEDADRCHIYGQKGGDPNEALCPQCPVYTECQERGYLSQIRLLQGTKVQISPTRQLFLDPQHAKVLEQILDSADEKERICIIDYRKIKIEDLFIKCRISKETLEQWAMNWRGIVLGNFAYAMLNVLEPNDNPVARVREVVHAFEQHEEKIVQQMCQINVRGKVVEHTVVDPETGNELARHRIDFEGGATAHIPLDANTGDKFKAKGLPFLPLDVFMSDVAGRYSEIAPAADIQIPMPMDTAVALGILDIGTTEKIWALPTVNRHPDWTFWHQLKRFFTHYMRDADAPMQWNSEQLIFSVPPVLHPSIKRLLLISPAISEHYLHRVFPSETIEFIPTKTTPWVTGNRVFQLRTGIYDYNTLLNNDSIWDVPSLSKTGERFLAGIRADIDRDPHVKHAIISSELILKLLMDLTEKENACFLKEFKMLGTPYTNFEAADVIWIVGTPYWPQSTIWWHSQVLFGNDIIPLNYEGIPESAHYKDKRIQFTYQQHVVGLLTCLIGRLGLNHLPDKKVVLMTSLPLPNITDRPETLFFDWEDFEIAGGLDKLPEVIATRERFEADYANLTGESSRGEVERLLGCSSRTANRVLQKLRGGNIQRISIREQILFLLATGEKKTSLLVEAIDNSAQTISNELKRLLNEGEIVRVRRGVYKLPDN